MAPWRPGVRFSLHQLPGPGAPAWAAAALALAVIAALYPILGAGLHTDDWLWLALARHMQSPWPAFVQPLGLEYFYRPVPIVLWWVSERLAGHHAAGHYAVSMLIHLGAALLSFALLRAWRQGAALALLAAAVFALAPVAAGTVLWLSNRNELLAVMFGLTALLAAERRLGGHGGAWAAGALLLAGLLCKESAFAFALALALRLALSPERGAAAARSLWLGGAVAIALAVGLRLWALPPGASGLGMPDPVGAAVQGVGAWLAWLPTVLSGLGTAPAVALACAGVMALAVTPALWRASPQAGVGLALLLAPALLQWPIVHQVLPDPEAATQAVNHRYFYTAMLGAALLAGAPWPERAPDFMARVRPVLLVALLLAWLPLSHGLARDWARATDDPHQRSQELAARVLEAQPGEGTVVQVRGSAPAVFAGYSDAVVKALAGRGSPAAGAAVFTDTAPHYVIAPRSRCAPEHWPGLRVRRFDDAPALHAYGSACLIGFEPLEAGAPPPRLVIVEAGNNPDG